jgi:hypothetical protein
MVATRHPLIDLVYNDETGRYIGHLERKLIKLTFDDLKMRSLLELLTGDPWDDYQFADEDGEIKRLAVDALKRRLGLTDSDARNLVTERWNRLNPPQADERTKTYLIGAHAVPDGPVVTHSRPISQPTPYDVGKHLQGLERAAKNRDAQRDEL